MIKRMKKDPHFALGVLTIAVVGGFFGTNAVLGDNTIVPIPDDVVLFASEHIIVQQDSDIVSGNVATNGALILEKETFLAESALADTSILQKDVVVSGNFETNELRGNNFTIQGETITPRVTSNFEIPPLPTITPGKQTLRIKDGETATIPPGQYNRIVIGKEANITLEEGTFHMNRLTIGRDTVLNINSPITLNVLQSINAGDNTLFNIGNDLDINDIRMNVAGWGVVSFKKNSVIAGILHAPNAAVFLGKESEWRGQVAGRQVVIGKEGIVSRDASFLMSSDSDAVVNNPGGGQVIVNEILVDLVENASRGTIDLILNTVDGRVTGLIVISNEIKIQISTLTITELETAIRAIENLNLPAIQGVGKNALIIVE